MKRDGICFGKIVLGIFLVCAVTVRADVVNIPDTYDESVTNQFVSGDGTTIYEVGSVIVFDGELLLTTNIVPVTYGTSLLATAQIYAEITLYETLPYVTDFTNKQAVVVGLFDTSSTTDGTLYAISGSDVDASWVQLTNNSQPMAVVDGNTNLITIILDYTNLPTVVYNVSLSSAPGASQISSQTLISPLSESSIAGYGVSGVGGLVTSASEAGDPGPLSSRVDFSVYATTNGAFRINLYTVDESRDGKLVVSALIDGVWVGIGSVEAVGSGNNSYQIDIGGVALQIGGSYLFKVVDEAGFVHESGDAIVVKAIRMALVQLTLNTFQFTFNSEPFKPYELLMTSDISSDWNVCKVEVYNYDKDAWASSNTQITGAPDGDTTTIRVPRAVEQTKAFYKIHMLD